MELNKVITGFLVFALFGIAFINFAVNFGTENDAGILITDNNSAISTIYEGINRTTYNAQDTANESFSTFNKDSGTGGGVLGSISDFFIKGIIFVVGSITGIANGIFNVTFAPILKAMGIPNPIAVVVGGIVSTIMLFTMVLLAWKLYRTGI